MDALPVLADPCPDGTRTFFLLPPWRTKTLTRITLHKRSVTVLTALNVLLGQEHSHFSRLLGALDRFCRKGYGRDFTCGSGGERRGEISGVRGGE
jgi:hypothetical protein